MDLNQAESVNLLTIDSRGDERCQHRCLFATPPGSFHEDLEDEAREQQLLDMAISGGVVEDEVSSQCVEQDQQATEEQPQMDTQLDTGELEWEVAQSKSTVASAKGKESQTGRNAQLTKEFDGEKKKLKTPADKETETVMDREETSAQMMVTQLPHANIARLLDAELPLVVEPPSEWQVKFEVTDYNLSKLHTEFDALLEDYKRINIENAELKKQLVLANRKIEAEELRDQNEGEITTEELLAIQVEGDDHQAEEPNGAVSSPVDKVQLRARNQRQLSLLRQQAEQEEEAGNDSAMEEDEETANDVAIDSEFSGTANIFKCRQCPVNRTFASAPLLAKHIERFHNYYQHCRYQCQQCGKPWPDKAALRDHMRTHTGEKPFKCSVCGKAFTVKSNLKVHERQHTGERPYVCNICQAAFHQQVHLTDHARIHSGETPYSCLHCGKQFKRKAHCHRHEKSCSKRPSAAE